MRVRFRVTSSKSWCWWSPGGALECLLDWGFVEGSSQFSAYGVMGYATHTLLLMTGIALVGNAGGLRGKIETLLVVCLSATLVILAVRGLVDLLVYHGLDLDLKWLDWVLRATFAAWVAAAVLHSARRFEYVGWRKLVLPGLAFIIVVSGVGYALPDAYMWYPTYDESDEQYTRPPDIESVYYAQPALLDRALDDIAVGRPGVPEVYFVGYASYANQEVFRREILYVQDLMERRYRAADRSVILLNHRDTLTDVPLANRPNLEHVLSAVGARMNLEEDAVLLFLTSHGSRDGNLSAELWPVEPNDLSADELRAALDASGIRWRILIVSACYSGTFIRALEDDHTLVLTAARKDRNSFGCSSDRELTYFGEHFFEAELSPGVGLLEAFDAARATLAERETREGHLPSEPQISLGDRMEEKLPELDILR